MRRNSIRLGNALGFQWDAGNRDKNLERHNVSDNEAEEAFFNHPLTIARDADHSTEEARFALHGVTDAGRTLFITFTMRGRFIRVISARDMTRNEYLEYEKTK